MDISFVSAVQKLYRWETGSVPVLVDCRCDAGSFATVADRLELSEDGLKLLLFWDKGRFSISLERAKFRENGDGRPILMGSPSGTQVLETLVITLEPNGYCKLTELPEREEEWPKSVSDLIQ